MLGLPAIRRFGALVAALLGLAALQGCEDCSDSLFTVRSQGARAAPAESRGRVPGNRYLAIDAKKKTSGNTAFSFLVVPRDLWAPFAYRVSGGVFDPERLAATNGAIFCTEVDERGSDPLVFWVLCAQVVGNGVTAFANAQGVAIGTPVAFPGTTLLELAVEADGTDLVFLARPPGEPAFSEIARTAFPAAAQDVPLVGSVGATSLSARAQVGFDDLALLENGAPPGPLSPEKQVVEALWRAAAHALAAFHALDGGLSNLDVARAALADAGAELAAAQAALPALAPGKVAKKAGKLVAKSAKQLDRAAGAVDDGDAERALAKIAKGAAAGGAAIQLLEPFTLSGE